MLPIGPLIGLLGLMKLSCNLFNNRAGSAGGVVGRGGRMMTLEGRSSIRTESLRRRSLPSVDLMAGRKGGMVVVERSRVGRSLNESRGEAEDALAHFGCENVRM